MIGIARHLKNLISLSVLTKDVENFLNDIQKKMKRNLQQRIGTLWMGNERGEELIAWW